MEKPQKPKHPGKIPSWPVSKTITQYGEPSYFRDEVSLREITDQFPETENESVILYADRDDGCLVVCYTWEEANPNYELDMKKRAEQQKKIDAYKIEFAEYKEKMCQWEQLTAKDKERMEYERLREIYGNE